MDVNELIFKNHDITRFWIVGVVSSTTHDFPPVEQAKVH